MRRDAVALLLAAGAAVAPAWAHQTSGGNSTSANLDFTIDIGKYLFFRVGTGTFPTASGTIDTVSFSATATIPPGAVTAVPGASTTVDWSGVLPAFSAPSTTLPVEVRSNAGPVTLRATATTLLTSGVNTIPMSQIVLTSSDPNLPAPVLPNAGQGAAVNVQGTAFSNLVTVRTADWTFSYTPLVTQRAGQYTGQVTFTASSP